MTVSSLKLNRSRCVLMAALLLLAPSLGAQQTGTMTGQITDSRTGRPISAVQVYISALDLGTLTQLNGRYLLLGVSPGTYTLTAERIGYERVEQEVTIGTGGASAAVQDFMLNEDALQLDEIIVTGTPGGTLRRALGNSVARVDVSGIAQTLQAPNLDQLLASATPGLNAVLGMSGDVAGGARIRVRGASSMQLGSTPLLYVDGVRVNNAFTGRTRSFATPLQSRLNDFNPEDIESIEIVKGPSAATLYGTEASAGVIQIITKRGRTGAPQFDISVEGGTNFLLDPQGKIANTYWMFEDGTVETWNFMEQREKDRVAGLDNDWLRRGVGLDVTGSVRGGTDQVRYYVSGSSNNQEGFVDWNFNDMLQGRANIDVILSDNFDLAVSSMTMRSKHRAAQNPRPFSISNHVTYAHAGRTSSRGYYIAPPETERLVENGGEMNRFTSSLQLNHTAGPFRSRVIAGYDRTDQILNEFFPPVVEGADHPDLGSFGLGQLTRTDLGVDALALEFGSSARFDLSPAWVSETAVGVQYNSERTTTGGVLASDFAAVGLTAVGAAAVRNASGTFIEDKSLGVYVQQQFEWENRRFFTVAVRGDSHSAFGANIDPQIYPKVSGAWVLHEEPFWDVSVLSSFRLRGAWGKAGRQPATFAALTLYRPQTGSGGVPSFTPGSIGDPDLKPEIGTEIELGFDAGILDDRTTLEFTFYNKTTKDALLTITPPGSTGFVGDNSGRAITQFVNAGEVNNRGVELSIDTDLWQSGAKWWDLRISGAYNKNKLVSLGEVSETTGTSRLVEGYPIGGLWSKEIVDAEWVGDHLTGMPINPTCLQEDGSVLPCDLDSNRDDLFKGPGDPVWLGSVYTSFSVTDNLRFFANVDFKSGYHMRSTTIGATHGSLNNTLAVTGFPQGGAVYRHDGDNGPLSADGLLPDPRVRFGLLEGGRWGRAWSQFPAGFARLRQISAQYTLPPSLAGRIGADRASVTLSGNNLWYLWQQTDWWYGVRVGDPEIGANTGSGAQFRTGGGNSDLLTGSTVSMTVRVGF
jgi:TonB-linked SusC/RagA family outer membrane protein